MKTGWSCTVLRDLIQPVATIDPRAEFRQHFTYVDLGAVDRDVKCITGPKTLPVTEAPSRARQLLRSGDVLVSTVRPNLNAVAMVAPDLDGMVGSTGFAVLRPSEKLDGRYLFHWVTTRAFVESMTRQATGASYPAVSDRIVKATRLPLPPLAEQRRIARVLDATTAVRGKRQTVMARIDALRAAIFHDMFGDPVRNPRQWPVSTIGAVADQVTDGEHQTPTRASEGIKLLSARNIRDGYIDYDNVDFIPLGEYERISRRCAPRRGDLLISCSGTIGRVAQVKRSERFVLVRSAAMIRPKRSLITTSFLEQYLRTPALKAKMLQRANASSQANLFLGQIRELPVLLPDIALQKIFTKHATSVDALIETQTASLAQHDLLFASLQHRAFSGEL
jgi:type I restriction enzyme, S subunit